jgi:hypothetical protein
MCNTQRGTYSDNVSRTAIAHAWGDSVNQDLGQVNGEQPLKRQKMSVEPPMDSNHLLTGYKSRGTTQDITLLKQRIIERAAKNGFTIDSSQFPWKALRRLLAEGGWYLKGWSPMSRMPGEKGTEKGITGLKANEQTAVFACLDDEDNPLTFVQYEGNLRGM